MIKTTVAVKLIQLVYPIMPVTLSIMLEYVTNNFIIQTVFKKHN